MDMLKPNMYVRSKINGTIGKITDIENIEVLNEKREVLIRGEKRYILDNNYNRGFCESENDSVIASHNIIDLIEVGDYVNGKKVLDVAVDYIFDYSEEIKIVYFDIDKKDYIYSKVDIKSIVTKEQFEQMEYKVVD